jgi:hypothetical protein
MVHAEPLDAGKDHRWRHPVAIAAPPAQQGLGTDTGSAQGSDLRLQVQLEAAAQGQDGAQFLIEFARRDVERIHFRLVKRVAEPTASGAQTGDARRLNEMQRFLAVVWIERGTARHFEIHGHAINTDPDFLELLPQLQHGHDERCAAAQLGQYDQALALADRVQTIDRAHATHQAFGDLLAQTQNRLGRKAKEGWRRLDRHYNDAEQPGRSALQQCRNVIQRDKPVRHTALVIFASSS